jgi:alanine-synthesizing transaminase
MGSGHSTATGAIPVATRISGFVYAIRNIVAEARKVEAAGHKVRYLNIGDPIPFGFSTPPHLIAAVERAMRDGHNGYAPSPGIAPARDAVAAELASRGMQTSAERVIITSGTSEGIELALTALADAGTDVLVPSPTYPLYTAVLAKIGARPVYYRTDPGRGWLPDLDHLKSLVTPATRALVVIDPNNPTGAAYPLDIRRGLVEVAEHHNIPILADEVYGDLAYSGPVPSLAGIDPDAAVLSFSSLSKAYLAPGWRAGWLAASRTPRLDDVVAAIKKLADGRLCSTAPMQHAIVAALTGDRSHQESFRAALRERAALTASRLSAMPGVSCVAPSAAFYAMPKIDLLPGRTDEDYVLSLLRATGILCVHGSGFGLPARDGFLRIVFLAPLSDLAAIYDDMAAFTREYRAA